MEKFEREKEPQMKKEFPDLFFIIIILFFLSIIFLIWLNEKKHFFKWKIDQDIEKIEIIEEKIF